LELTPFDEGLRQTFEWYRAQERPAPDVEWEDALLARLD
jgi:dTDP-D-glucose 4,6-dehydratase